MPDYQAFVLTFEISKAYMLAKNKKLFFLATTTNSAHQKVSIYKSIALW